MTRPPRAPAASLGIDELLDQSPWFTRLDAQERQLVLSSATERVVAMGQSLSHHGERQHAWFGVLEGLIKWSITAADGRSITLGGQSVGSWFGEGTLLRDAPRESDLVALRHSRVAQLPRDIFEALRRQNPGFNEYLLQQVNERLHWLMGNLVARVLMDTESQVVRALLSMVHPLLNPRGERHLQLSQEELANLAGVSRQSCNAALMRLKQASVVRIEYGAIVVLDLPALQRLMR
jgi:CRP/FNR family transcriptional regulator, cyclic AMP receptor protein